MVAPGRPVHQPTSPRPYNCYCLFVMSFRCFFAKALCSIGTAYLKLFGIQLLHRLTHVPVYQLVVLENCSIVHAHSVHPREILSHTFIPQFLHRLTHLPVYQLVVPENCSWCGSACTLCASQGNIVSHLLHILFVLLLSCPFLHHWACHCYDSPASR